MSNDKNRFKYARMFAYSVAFIAFIHATISALPPRHITIGAGPKDGAYHEISLKYKTLLEKKGYDVDIVQFDSTVKIADKVNDSQSDIDVGFVAQDLRGNDFDNLVSLGEIQSQPVFIFAN